MPYQRSSVHSNGYSTDGRPNEGGSGSSGESAPTYLLEHLATFTVAKETGIVYPADGMRRLLQLEKSNGIWSQKMQWRLESNCVLIINYESGGIVERFPVSQIHEPTAFTSHDPMEIYNNILVFIVSDEKNSRSEMHIFQCQSISAQELVEDLKLSRIGKAPPARRPRHIPPPPPTPPPEPPLNGVNVREQVNAFNAASQRVEAFARGNDMIGGGPSSRDPATLSMNDETSSTSSEKYERDVTILNHCFDDIEKFIARLQHAAAASRELERRRKSRKSKKKDMGDGMLTMRAKPPPEVEFVDIFQKFKLSFNLLAKLKAHIHDPNAPELVHFLFTPLALIVDASHDTHYGPNLPAKVVSPLLTREAVNLLINCVTSKETELWHSLGDAWLIPRDQWKGYVAPYHPLFMDGWSPEFPVMDDRDQPAGPDKRSHAEDIRAAQQEADNEPHYGSDYFDDDLDPVQNDSSRYYRGHPDRYRERSQSPVSSDRDYPTGPPLPLRDVTARSDISADSIERNGSLPGGHPASVPAPVPAPAPAPAPGPGPDSQQRFERAQHRWLQDLKAQGAKVVQVTYPRTANNDKELTVIRGEYLEILDDSRKWWKARNSRGQIAHVPHTIVTPPATEASEVFSNPVYVPRYDRTDRDGIGSAPAPATGANEWHPKDRQGKKAGVTANGGIPPPPPLPMPPPSPSPRGDHRVTFSRSASNSTLGDADTLSDAANSSASNNSTISRKSQSNGTSSSSVDLMHAELRMLLAKTPRFTIPRTPEVFINQHSSDEEVKEWLRLKGFSDSVVKRLAGLAGNTLLALKKDDLQRLMQDSSDKDEIKRLDSQLKKQRASHPFFTSRTRELNAVLARARRKAEMEDVAEEPDSREREMDWPRDHENGEKTGSHNAVINN